MASTTRLLAIGLLLASLASFYFRWGFLQSGWDLSTDFGFTLFSSEPSTEGSRFYADGQPLAFHTVYTMQWWNTLFFLVSLAATFAAFVLSLVRAYRMAAALSACGFIAAGIGMGALAARVRAIPDYPSFILDIGWHGLNIGYFGALLALFMATGSLLLNARSSASK